MNVDNAVNFLIGSILFSFGTAMLGILLVFLNYIFTTYWRPVNFGYWAPRVLHDIVEKGSQPSKRFMTDEEYAEYQKQKIPHTVAEDDQPKIEPKLEK